MEMEDLERKLQSLSPAGPSAELRSRIFGTAVHGGTLGVFLRKRIPLGWAAVLAVGMGIIGMTASQLLWRGEQRQPRATTVQVNIVEPPSGRNAFDFSEPAAQFLPGKLSVSVEPVKEI